MRSIITLKRNRILLYFSVFYFSFLFIFQKVMPGYFDDYLVVILIPVLAIISGSKVKIPRYAIGVVSVFIAIIILSTKPHSNFIYYFVGVELIILLCPELEDIDVIVRLLNKIGLVYAITVIVSFLFPAIFQQYAIIVFPREVALDYIDSLSKGYNTGINYQVSFTALYISLALLIEVFYRMPNERINYIKLAVLFLALVLTNKRAHLLYLFATYIIVFYFIGKRSKKLDRLVKIILLLLLMLFLFRLALYFMPNVPVLSRLSSLFDRSMDINSVTSGRISIYTQMISLFAANKWTGIGWQNFAEYSNARSFSAGINQGHNVFLQLLCETGIIGLTFFIVIMVMYFVKAKKASVDMIAFPEYSRYAKIGFCFYIFYFLFWISGNPLYEPVYYFTWIIGLIIIFRSDFCFRKGECTND